MLVSTEINRSSFSPLSSYWTARVVIRQINMSIEWSFSIVFGLIMALFGFILALYAMVSLYSICTTTNNHYFIEDYTISDHSSHVERNLYKWILPACCIIPTILMLCHAFVLYIEFLQNAYSTITWTAIILYMIGYFSLVLVGLFPVTNDGDTDEIVHDTFRKKYHFKTFESLAPMVEDRSTSSPTTTSSTSTIQPLLGLDEDEDSNASQRRKLA